MPGSRISTIICIGSTVILLVLYIQLSMEFSSLKSQLSEKDSIHQNRGPGDPNDYHSNELLVIYNRVPKTGSTSFIGLAYSLCSSNKFHVIHINTSKNNPTLSMSDQSRFVRNVSFWEEKKPAIYHGHIAYIDFTRFGDVRFPLYINIIRKPIERLVSYFYFLRYGDDLRPYLIRKRQGDKMTFDECIEMQHKDCSMQHLWVQVPFFCGHYMECWNAGSDWALEQAKHNLVHKYFLVGVTEQMEDFVAMMEYSLPRFFSGALKLYLEGTKSHIRKTIKKILPSEKSIENIKNTKVWQMENEFYNFARDQFNFHRSKTLIQADNKHVIMERGKAFSYEKIKPK